MPTSEPHEIEVSTGRTAEVGGLAVNRVLPNRQRRTVGSWCFVDLMGPGQVGDDAGLDVGPHPHIGLQTVTWLLDGAILHRDSLGSEQVIRPGQLNLMTAGRGVSHAEETTGTYRGRLQGVQLWVAQPTSTREGEPAFEHHATLPQIEVGNAVATVLVGQFIDARSPARRDTEHVGVDLAMRTGATTVPLDPSFEHAVLVVQGGATVGSIALEAGSLGYLGIGRDEVRMQTDQSSRILLLGGTPFPEELVMWWNYVARSREEITKAHSDWSNASPRFGTVASPVARIDTAGPPWATGTF